MDYSVASRQQLYILSAYVQMYRCKESVARPNSSNENMWKHLEHMLPPVLLTSAHLALLLSCTASTLEHYFVAAKNQVLIEQLWSAGLQLSLGPDGCGGFGN